MRLSKLLLVLASCWLAGGLVAQTPSGSFSWLTEACEDDAQIRVAFSDATELSTCNGDGLSDRIRFTTSSRAMLYAYMVVDENDIIVWIDWSNFIDFEKLPPGNLRVFAFSHLGSINAEVGDNYLTTPLALPCAGITTNFIAVNNFVPSGGTVTTEDGATSVVTCPGDGVSDLIRFDSTGVSGEQFTYLVTDENNVLLNIPAGDSQDFEDAPPGNCRVWGLAYSGALLVTAGDDITAVDLAESCYGLSENFVTISRQSAEGGQVLLEDGSTETLICPGDALSDILRFDSTGVAGPQFTYLVTDDNNVVLSIPTGDSEDFNDIPAGTCRVWGLAYAGDLLVAPGDDAATIDLASGCFDLSDNFITVYREVPDGGTVATEDGESTVYVCPGDELPDLIAVDSSGTSVFSSYTYVVTDAENNILSVPGSDVIDFNDAPPGECRIWGLAYTGNLTAAVGDNAAAVALSDDCFDLSDNFVTVLRIEPDGGTVATEDGETELLVCPGDGISDLIRFDSTGVTAEFFTYVITDEDNNILTVPAGDSFDFEEAGAGIARVWGLAYTGNLTAMVGDNAAEVALSDDCFDLSDNFVTVERLEPDGGTVETENGETEVVICPDNGVLDEFAFVSTGASGPNFAYVITDDQNNIIEISEASLYDFDGLPEGTRRFWGLSYAGELIAPPGSNATEVALADGCFDLSDNFVAVHIEAPDGGTVQTEGGETTTFVCPGDEMADIIAFDSLNTSIHSAYQYIVTTVDNSVLALPTTDELDFDIAPPGTYRIWGVAYTGTLNVFPGDIITDGQPLSDDCFDLSDNFITVVSDQPDGGTVETEDGKEEVKLCPDDGLSDVIYFDSTTTSNSAYIYVVTDEDNIILEIASGDSVDFSGAPLGICRVWGLSYSGNLTAAVGDDAAAVALSDDCYELSENFVTIIRENADGGTIATDTGETEVLVCPNDGNPDIVNFDISGQSGPQFTYVITDENNVILTIPQNDFFDFDTAPADICRVWGLSYAGDITAQLGDVASEVELATGCFDLSDNFITVVRETPNGGTVQTESGADVAYTCARDEVVDIVRFDSLGTSAFSDYVYVVTANDNRVLLVVNGDSLNFSVAPAGTYRVWGVAYTGNLTILPSVDLTIATLSDDCYDLSDNFITIIQDDPDGGTVQTEDGAMEVSLCPGDGLADVIRFDSLGTSNSPYVYVVTDTANVIQNVVTADSIDFDDAGEGISRVWGLAYTGDITAQVGDTASVVALTDGCFDLSDNFVTVIRQGVDGGTVATAPGNTSIVFLCAGDGTTNELTFSATGAQGPNYSYLITTEEGVVLDIAEGDSYDFEGLPDGNCRVYGLAHVGDLTAMAGNTLGVQTLAEGCNDLSDNFVLIIKGLPEGGSITTAQGDSLSLCSGDDTPDLIEFSSTGDQELNYVYLVTQDSFLVGTLEGTSFDFNNALGGTYQIYGLAYAGSLTAFPGDNIFTAPIATDCYDLTDNFITLFIERVEGGTISTVDNETTLYTCPSDPPANLFEFKADFDAQDSEYVYLVTTTTGIVLVVIEGNTYDFTGFPLETGRIYGLSYTGNLQAQPGTSIDAVLSDGCYSVSDNFISVFNEEPDGGTVSIAPGGATDLLLCVGNDDPVLDFSTTTNSVAAYRFVLTDTNNVVQAIFTEPTIDFTDFAAGFYRVWGLSYTGTLLLSVGDDVDEIGDLATSCFELSANFVAIERAPTLTGGVLSFPSSITDSDTLIGCPNAGNPDIALVFTTSPDIPYSYVITDDMGRVIIPNVNNNIIPFDAAGPGIYRIYGYSYLGNQTLFFGQDIEAVPLSDYCYNLSENFLTVIIETPDGATVSTETGDTEVSVAGDTTLVVSNTASPNLPYYYVLTDADNSVIAQYSTDSIDLSGIDAGTTYRIHGVSYTGTAATLPVGEMLDLLDLSDDCYDLSDNFIVINPEDGIQQPDVERPAQLSESLPDILLSPNPSAGLFRAELPVANEEGGTIRIFNSIGQVESVIPVAPGQTLVEINLPTLPNGYYVLRFDSETYHSTARFLKQ
jgi:hypothetical protein